ncbi:hypothetical protein WOSG25_061380 [Weissella oryzae SG25]|uniref:Uncharacterized protein n=1 Tax=Weissella oryzae (strain DSM 25784 / JCM 18191 / LMG 30913 / SG25) TaxID=1329250 RepID=A0A069CUU6_WEIOS|nr:hypothetical protein [Weissella oryzae]GAK31008.1 hypothetical protein WOSG25_061380 [Weissella oryzae SG25]
MKYTDQVIFVNESGNHYDPDLGRNVHNKILEYKQVAHVVVPSIEKSTVVFGDIRTDVISLHLKQPFLNTYDFCLVALPGREIRKYFFVTEKRVGNRQVITMRGGENGASS